MSLTRLRLYLFPFLLLSCSPTATSTGYTPVTSISITADSIIPSARCGRAANQLPKYSAVLVGGTGNTYDCFADALFTNTPAQVEIEVFAWSPSVFDTNANIVSASQSGDIAALAQLPFAIHKKCTATQHANVQVIASCVDMGGSDAGPPSDAASDAAMDASMDASSDGSKDAPSDAPDGG